MSHGALSRLLGQRSVLDPSTFTLTSSHHGLCTLYCISWLPCFCVHLYVTVTRSHNRVIHVNMGCNKQLAWMTYRDLFNNLIDHLLNLTSKQWLFMHNLATITQHLWDLELHSPKVNVLNIVFFCSDLSWKHVKLISLLASNTCKLAKCSGLTYSPHGSQYQSSGKPNNRSTAFISALHFICQTHQLVLIYFS